MDKRHVLRLATIVGAGLLAGFIVGCGRPPRLQEGPIELGPEPIQIQFSDSLRSSSDLWEVWMEFRRSRDSHHAARVQAVLISPDGIRDSLRVTDIDRRGEAIICLTGELRDRKATHYRGMELRADRPMRLRQLRGGGLVKK